MASTLELLMMARAAGKPVARAYATSAQTAISTAVQLALAATSFDNLGGFSGTGVYTVPVAGTYRCYGKAKFAQTASNYVHLILYHNGAAVAFGPEQPTTTASYYGCHVEDLVQCNVGDTLALYAGSATSIATAIPDGGNVDVYFNISLDTWA